MEENNIDIPLKDVTDPETLSELDAIAGKTQIPCLLIDGKPMHESDDIIGWLGANWSKQ